MSINTCVDIIYVIRHQGRQIDLREVAFEFVALPWVLRGANCSVAGAHADGRFLAFAVVCDEVDVEDALEACLATLEDEGVEAAVAYSPQHGAGVPGFGTPERASLFGIGRSLAANRGIHLVDWLLCDNAWHHCLKAMPVDPSTWWDCP